MSLARNALVVVVATLMAYIFLINDEEPFTLTGKLTEGLPNFNVPEFSITHNGTTSSFGSVLAEFGSSLAFIPLVCILESVAISKAFSKGKTVDATQEMLAVGISNLLGSFFGSMPVTGSFTRTAVNNASGVQTTFGGIITGSLVLLACAFLTSYFSYIPKASLAAVIICAMVYLFDYEAILVLWRTKKMDLIPFGVTFIASLVIGLEYGILIGIATNLLFVLYTSMKPKIDIDTEKLPEGDVFIVTPSVSLQFPSAEYVRQVIMKRCNSPKTTVIIDGKYISSIDATVAKNFKTLVDDLKLRDQTVIFWNFKDNVKDVCAGVDINMHQYFREAKEMNEIVDNPALNRRGTDIICHIE